MRGERAFLERCSIGAITIGSENERIGPVRICSQLRHALQASIDKRMVAELGVDADWLGVALEMRERGDVRVECLLAAGDTGAPPHRQRVSLSMIFHRNDE